MTIVRNIQVKLDITKENQSIVDATFEEFQRVTEPVIDYGWSNDPDDIITNKNQLNEATYREIREDSPLTGGHVQSARNLAANALSNGKRLLEDRKSTSKPGFKGTVVTYNSNTITYNDDHCTLSTVDGRIRAEYVFPHEDMGTPFEEYWNENEWVKKEATLHKRDGEYYLHVAVDHVGDTNSSDDSTENGVVLGVDLNVDGYLAVTSTGAFLGNANELNHKRDEYERRRGDLQQTGTRSAHLTIQSIGDRFAEWSRHRLHNVSNDIIQEAIEHDCTYIAFERLTYVWTRISNASKFQQWAFRKLQRQVEYKAEEYNIGVEKVAPQYTSQRCSLGECGYIHNHNRDSDKFECLKCGKKLHADYNAARNVAWRLVQNWLKSGSGRATGQLALKSGVVNANGHFRPTALRS
jgi:putative transposase